MAKLKYKTQTCCVCKKASPDGLTHFGCKKKYGLDARVSLWRYHGALRRALHALKYRFAKEIADEIAGHMANAIRQSRVLFPEKAVVVPIPLHRLRGNWRGFNQAEVIGKKICRQLGWKMIPGVLLRKISTQPQARLNKKERKVNIKDAFEFNEQYRYLRKDVTIILLDDVYTTGLTMNEACKVLKKEGFKSVWGLSLAR